MKKKIIIFTLMILVMITCSTNVFADENIVNTTLTTSYAEIEVISQDNSSDVLTTSEITITDDNYDNYFNKYTGKLKDDVDININTIKIGNVSNKAFTIDRPLNIMPISSDCEISNGVIHLIAGSSGSNITGLTINNTKGEIYQDGLFVSKAHGIWFSNSSDNLIFNNTIRIPGAEGCYAMPMGYSSRNKILYNDVVSTFTSCILMGSCDYNNISYNSLKIKYQVGLVVANVIYFNCFGHADYSGPATCIGTYISNNYIETAENNMFCYTLNVLGESNDTKIINNTVVKGFYGIKVSDEWLGIQAKNVLIEKNTVINAYYSIESSSRNVIVSNNNIIGSSMLVGIDIIGDNHNDNVSVFGNEIIYGDLDLGISVFAKANVFNNTIILSRYGGGIHVRGNGCLITDNNIYVNDNAIGITGNNTIVKNNIIHGKANGIFSKNTDEKRETVNNTIIYNKIYSESYAIYIQGYVYNTTVNNNYIETNQNDAFYIDVYPKLENNNPGKISDNTVNGVIKDTEILIINDTNFYDYFDEKGYLKYDFKDNSQKFLFLTFLSNKNLYFTDSITLTSNKQANLLYNVTITLKGDACDSTIKDFKFYSFDKESIILDGVDNVVVKDNDFTTLTSDVFDIKTISVIRGCNFCNITGNNIFINSNAYYTYAISVSEPQSTLIKKFSNNFTISNNNILIKSSGVAEAMYFDALTESNITKNNINIISEDSAYGVSICDIIGRPGDINIDSNKIIITSNEMSYLIELFKVDNCKISNNYLKGISNGVYAIGAYNSSSTICGNEIIVEGSTLTTLPPADALGKGNVAVYITKQSQIKEFKNNIIDSQNCQLIDNSDSNIRNMNSNSFVISNYNYDLFFNSQGRLSGENIKDGDIILFKNFTNSKIMNFNVSVSIKPHSYLNEFKAILILSNGSNKSTISGFNFNNANIMLNNVSDISISLNNFNDSKIGDYGGVNNSLLNNSIVFNLDNSYCIVLNNCLNDTFAFNNISVNSSNVNFIDIESSNLIQILNNSFEIFGNSIRVINSNLSNSVCILNNAININATGDVYGYHANNSTNDLITNNTISIYVIGRPVAIYYNNSSKNSIIFNRIISNSNDGQDYAIIIDSQNNNVVTNNYLISSNGFRRGDDAVNATNNIVHDNLPVIIYVSTNGSEEGNGTFENPYPTIKKAIENCLSGSIIYILPGMYNESNIVIDKNITLTAINLEGNTYINALNNQLFNIKKGGILTVNALKIFNGFSVNGGSLFNNHGRLVINNSLIYNSSSYYNNSNPIFNVKKKYDPSIYIYTRDCSNEGVGGAILNYGDLIISSSTLFDNFAHKGGAIADFGKTTIKDSLICNNVGVHGGAIYTDSKEEFIIENSIFRDNLAIQTLDYCYIQRVDVDYHMETIRYQYLTMCGVLPGLGGAIFSNTRLSIDNSSFEHNLAKTGGAIAYNSNLLTNQNYYHDELEYSKGSEIEYSQTSVLNIKNSIFKDNEATNTSCGNLSMLVDKMYGGKYYNIHFNGGAIFGALTQFNVYNSTFVHNSAFSDGGSLCVQSLDSSIELCKFYDNVAGGSGGVLDVFGNFEIFNSEIINNSANYGGAIQYSSISTGYGRIQNNMVMFNVTVAGNKALTAAGAFLLRATNFAIKNSNIYDNFAPEGSTFSGKYDLGTGSNIDARGNWWGSTNGPDDSVWTQSNVRFRTWAGQKVDWKSVLVKGSNGNDIKNDENTGKSSTNVNTVSTGSGAHTGSTLSSTLSYGSGSSGFRFSGNWPNGNNMGNNGGIGDYDGINPYGSSGESKTNVKGNAVNQNSLSKTNSSNVNDLPSVGLSSNAADSSTSSQSSSSDGGSFGSGKAYEIKEVKKEMEDDLTIFNILFILLWIFLFIGFYTMYKKIDKI